MSNPLNFYSNFERCILMGDFNCEPSNPHLAKFQKDNSLYCHTKGKTCFKKTEGTCIDLILSNQKYGLKKIGSWDTGISDFHHLIYTQLKSRLPDYHLKRLIIDAITILSKKIFDRSFCSNYII